MNKLQLFIASLGFGSFLRETQMPDLIKLDRLCPVLVRCGGKRFQCAAQDCADMIRAVEQAGDYVRDVSIPVGGMERAEHWREERPYVDAWTQEARKLARDSLKIVSEKVNPKTGRSVIRCASSFDESQCGGVFDGRGVVSDADPGL